MERREGRLYVKDTTARKAVMPVGEFIRRYNYVTVPAIGAGIGAGFMGGLRLALGKKGPSIYDVGIGKTEILAGAAGGGLAGGLGIGLDRLGKHFWEAKMHAEPKRRT